MLLQFKAIFLCPVNTCLYKNILQPIFFWDEEFRCLWKTGLVQGYSHWLH